MSRLVIEGSRRLGGEVEVQGAKNSILPILAASIMCKDECVIKNCPDISDVRVKSLITWDVILLLKMEFLQLIPKIFQKVISRIS